MTLARTCTLSLALFASGATAARAEAAAPDGAHELKVSVGESIPICGTNTIICPASGSICDDPSIVAGEITDQGLVFRGKKPGTTLCSAQGSGGQGARSLYRITVTPREQPHRVGDTHDRLR